MATHRFEPTRWYTTIGPHEPALRIADGDAVVTTTVDAGGCNHRGEQVAGWPNPMTGPFYVDGASAGDTLAVRFDRLWPNRRHGYSCGRLAAHVVDPDYVVSFTGPPERVRWDLDLERGTAIPADRTAGLGRLRLPLRPMLGCFGVAPPGGQAISTATSGSYGGNMDYRGFEQGVTVYLPVAVDGALFFLGDGHAVQGDGEVVGMGIETTFDVQFTATVRKGAPSSWPRFETSTHIGAAGNARPLDQALQHATTELVRWLLDGYGLAPAAAHTLLGQCVEYDIANVFDPAYTVVARLSKDVLAQVAGPQ